MIIGVDTGGTFTDFIYVDEGTIKVLKLPSTPDDPSRAVVEGVRRIAGDRSFKVIHGSTVATNALLERKGAKVALITNRGFEDLLEIQRQNRERIYQLCYRKPRPLVPRELRFGVSGRVDAQGKVLEEIDPEEVESLSRCLKDLGVDSVAVSFLFCFLRPEHEARAAEILREGGFKVYTSSEIVPVFREYERTSTTVINAYVAPIMESYLKRLEDALGEGTVSVMQSNGGRISVERASKEAVRTILSGPAGGVVAAKHLGTLIGLENLITLDMGGTSTDVSLIEGGREQYTTDYRIDGLPIAVPVIDIHTIGAGGGSIAYVDAGGALRVGPESAGADPGPVCYGRGERITVTDAHLYTGRLLPDHFLGGSMRLYPERVGPYMERLAQGLSISPLQLAEGIISVANSNMEAAIRAVSVERGHDPAAYSLVVFGGAGALHGAELADAMGIPRVVVPRHPGIFSAMGMLLSDTVKDYQLTVMLEDPDVEDLERVFGELYAKASEDMSFEGFGDFAVFRYLHCRFKGQSYEVDVPFSHNYIDAFMKRYRELYGMVLEDRPVEVVNVSLVAVGTTEKPSFECIPPADSPVDDRAFLKGGDLFYKGKLLRCRFYLRDKLMAGDVVEGPAVILEYSSTTFIPPDFVASVDSWGNILLERVK